MGNVANQLLAKVRDKKKNTGSQEVGRRKTNLVWLNFLYTLFGVEIIYKGFLGVGTMYTLIDEFQKNPGIFLVNGKNVLSFCAVTLILLDIVIKFFALISTRKPDGYTLMIWSLGSGAVSSTVYLFFDQGWVVGLVFAVIFGLWFWLNFIYVRNRKWCYTDPEML